MSMTFASDGFRDGILVGAYAVTPYNKIRMFYSKDHGNTFEIIEATENHKVFHVWNYRTESININGGMATKIVSMFSQISKDQIELDIFDFKSLSVSKNIDNPFKEVNRAYGAILDSYILSGAFHLTAMAAIEDEKGRTHLKVSQYHFGW
eukprot:TRINITY_DN4516_c0_g1_i7.p2 TRINITY_DN4516_c0_g1~~TRINITY_DN4516_c0_g1_i7.p2  ORF type:complete len:150 (-),score=21.11 TRINITY_DN4516_c0_g1_i7:139-588(-)